MKSNKGITLIALVVTIIVLLILAGVAIAMLRGDNGILNRASEAKYDNVIGSVNEEVKLAQMALRTNITSNMVSKPGYIATSATNFAALKTEIVNELKATVVEPGENKTQEGYIVYSYLDAGDDKTDGVGYILITYSDNSLRSSLTKDVEGTLTDNKIGLNGVTFTRAEASGYSVNQAVLAYVIRVTNYNCSLSNAVLTTSTSRAAVSSTPTSAADFCNWSLNSTTKVYENGKNKTTIGNALEF